MMLKFFFSNSKKKKKIYFFITDMIEHDLLEILKKNVKFLKTRGRDKMVKFPVFGV
jgi:hypothetical protein